MHATSPSLNYAAHPAEYGNFRAQQYQRSSTRTSPGDSYRAISSIVDTARTFKSKNALNLLWWDYEESTPKVSPNAPHPPFGNFKSKHWEVRYSTETFFPVVFPSLSALAFLICSLT